MYRNLLKKPWISQVVLNTKKQRAAMWKLKKNYLTYKGYIPLCWMFVWENTPQGYDYWCRIDRLNILNR